MTAISALFYALPVESSVVPPGQVICSIFMPLFFQEKREKNGLGVICSIEFYSSVFLDLGSIVHKICACDACCYLPNDAK